MDSDDNSNSSNGGSHLFYMYNMPDPVLRVEHAYRLYLKTILKRKCCCHLKFAQETEDMTCFMRLSTGQS